MNVYIDFDRTLFDTDMFLKDLHNLLKNNNVDMEVFNKYQDELKENGFNPFDILKKMENASPFNNDVYKQLDELIENSNTYVYSDVDGFLEMLKEKKYHIILLTKGNEDYQLAKIKNTDVIKYFDDIIITLKNKGKLDINYQNDIFIDDNPYEIESILKRNPKRMIRIKRANAKYNDINVEGKIEEVENLNEIKI